MSDRDPSPYDHYRPAGTGDVPDGVYRVVGAAEGEVTLLAVADASSRRVHDGRLVRVPAARVPDDFEAAPNSDSAVDLADLVDWIRWLPRALRDRLP